MYGLFNLNMYKLFNIRLNRFLILNYEITTYACDIFEETLLKMAGITASPRKCAYKLGEDDHFLLKLTGIRGKKLKILRDYLKQYGKVDLSIHYFRPSVLSLEMNTVYKKIFPHFVSYWKTLEKTPEGKALIKAYSLKCMKQRDPTYYKLYQDIQLIDKNPSSNDQNSRCLNLYFLAKKRLLNSLLVSTYCHREFDLQSAKKDFLAVCVQEGFSFVEALRKILNLKENTRRVPLGIFDFDLFLAEKVNKAEAFSMRLENYRVNLAKTLTIFELVSKHDFVDLPYEIQVILVKNINGDFFQVTDNGYVQEQQFAVNSLVESSVTFFKTQRENKNDKKSSAEKFTGFLESTERSIEQIAKIFSLPRFS